MASSAPAQAGEAVFKKSEYDTSNAQKVIGYDTFYNMKTSY
jgi:hypothetical protein